MTVAGEWAAVGNACHNLEYDCFTIGALTHAGRWLGGIEHVVNEVGGSSTILNPDAPVDVVSYP